VKNSSLALAASLFLYGLLLGAPDSVFPFIQEHATGDGGEFITRQTVAEALSQGAGTLTRFSAVCADTMPAAVDFECRALPICELGTNGPEGNRYSLALINNTPGGWPYTDGNVIVMRYQHNEPHYEIIPQSRLLAAYVVKAPAFVMTDEEVMAKNTAIQEVRDSFSDSIHATPSAKNIPYIMLKGNPHAMQLAWFLRGLENYDHLKPEQRQNFARQLGEKTAAALITQYPTAFVGRLQFYAAPSRTERSIFLFKAIGKDGLIASRLTAEGSIKELAVADKQGLLSSLQTASPCLYPHTLYIRRECKLLDDSGGHQIVSVHIPPSGRETPPPFLTTKNNQVLISSQSALDSPQFKHWLEETRTETGELQDAQAYLVTITEPLLDEEEPGLVIIQDEGTLLYKDIYLHLKGDGSLGLHRTKVPMKKTSETFLLSKPTQRSNILARIKCGKTTLQLPVTILAADEKNYACLPCAHHSRHSETRGEITSNNLTQLCDARTGETLTLEDVRTHISEHLPAPKDQKKKSSLRRTVGLSALALCGLGVLYYSIRIFAINKRISALQANNVPVPAELVKKKEKLESARRDCLTLAWLAGAATILLS